MTYYKGADIGECLSTAYRIKEGFESWHQEWLKTAKRVHRYAKDSLAAEHKISAREAYLRASNYYTVAEFLLINPGDTRIQDTCGYSKECFSKAICFMRELLCQATSIKWKECMTRMIM